jgi:glutamate racemase
MQRILCCIAAILFFTSFSAAQHDRPIGVFDSGTGGLTVLQAIVTLDEFNNTTGLPGADGVPDFTNEAFQYLADQANMPYGNYSSVNKTELLKEHILKGMDFLLNQSYETGAGMEWMRNKKSPVKMIVIGCNTATAYALEDITAFAKKKDPGIPVVGVINAGVKAAMAYQKTTPGTIGVFATAGTVASNGYPNAIRKMAKETGLSEPSIVSQGGVGLAEAIDKDWSYIADTVTAVRTSYRGPSMTNTQLPIEPSLLPVYNFNADKNKLLCEFDPSGNCLEMQLNDPANYVRYHLVTMLEKMKRERYTVPLNTLLLACTHYPYLRDTISNVLGELYDVQTDGNYRYRDVLASHVELIDPAVETAKEAYGEMRKKNLQRMVRSVPMHTFFISIPNTSLKEIQLQPDGWFTYEYKYGRTVGAKKQYVRFVPFDTRNVSSDTYQRFSIAIPEVYRMLTAVVKDLPAR